MVWMLNETNSLLLYPIVRDYIMLFGYDEQAMSKG